MQKTVLGDIPRKESNSNVDEKSKDGDVTPLEIEFFMVTMARYQQLILLNKREMNYVMDGRKPHTFQI